MLLRTSENRRSRYDQHRAAPINCSTVGYDGFVTAEIFPPAHGLWESQIWTTSKAMDFILGRAKRGKA